MSFKDRTGQAFQLPGGLGVGLIVSSREDMFGLLSFHRVKFLECPDGFRDEEEMDESVVKWMEENGRRLA